MPLLEQWTKCSGLILEFVWTAAALKPRTVTQRHYYLTSPKFLMSESGEKAAENVDPFSVKTCGSLETPLSGRSNSVCGLYDSSFLLFAETAMQLVEEKAPEARLGRIYVRGRCIDSACSLTRYFKICASLTFVWLQHDTREGCTTLS